MVWVEAGGNWRPLGKSQEPLWEAWDIGRTKNTHLFVGPKDAGSSLLPPGSSATEA